MISRLATILALGLLALAPAAASAAKQPSVRVGPEYFGVNYPSMAFDPDVVRERQLDAIQASGIEQVRGQISWRLLEPEAPRHGVHDYDWRSSDFQVTALARHRLRMMPAFLLAPIWAGQPGLSCSGTSVTRGTRRIGDYAEAARALATRYGPGGAFWREHPGLPRMQIRTWQIWNEPNLAAYWCPQPDPTAYAELFAHAAQAIHEAQPRARVITAGLSLDTPAFADASAGAFLEAISRARPDLWQIADGAGAHMYPPGKIERSLDAVAHWRQLLTFAGAPPTEPIFVTEIGWGLIGAFDMTEAERAARYRYFTRRVPRSTCNVAMMNAHAWTTAHDGPVFDFNAGIADPESAELFPSAIAFRDAVALMRGTAGRQAPHSPVRNCRGMPKLDRDTDRVAEHRDYYPTDRRRWRGPKPWYR